MGERKTATAISIATGIGLGAFLMQGCFGVNDEDAKSGIRIRPQLIRAETRTERLEGLSGALAKAATADPDPDLHWSSGVAITSLKVPVKQISLHNAAFDHEADIYTCAGSSEACQVEMAGSAFQDALNAVPRLIEMGQYDYVFVKTCEDSEGEYRTALTGSVSLDGKTWYTHTASVLDTAGPATPIAITSSGCGRTYALPHPLRITDSLGATVDFKLYFDIQDLAYAALGSRKTAQAWTPGNCRGDRPAESETASAPFLCIGYPDISGVLDTAAAVLERYINQGATVGLFFTADDAPIGGYTRRYFTEGVLAEPGFPAVMPLRSARKNGDGTLAIDGFGPAGHAYDTALSVFRAPTFQRWDHAGTFLSTGEGSVEMTAHDYEARRLP